MAVLPAGDTTTRVSWEQEIRRTGLLLRWSQGLGQVGVPRQWKLEEDDGFCDPVPLGLPLLFHLATCNRTDFMQKMILYFTWLSCSDHVASILRSGENRRGI